MLESPRRSALLDRDAQGAQKVYILRVKSPISWRTLTGGRLNFGDRLLLNLIQPDRRFQHQEHVEALLANVLHHFRDVFGLGN